MIRKRYQLKKGKFGCYFYDTEANLDLTLEMVLNKLNSYDIKITKAYERSNKLKQDIYQLKQDD